MKTRWQRLQEVLSEGDFRLLLAAQALAQAADGVAQAALADVLILEGLTSGTPSRILSVFALTLLPYSVVAPFLGVFVDRWSRRALLTWTNVVRGVLLGSLPFWSGALTERQRDAALYVGVIILLGLGRLFLTTKGAVLPAVLHERHLLASNSISSGGGMVAALAGGAVGVLALKAISPEVAFGIAGIAYVAAAAMARLISAPLGHPHKRLERLRAALARVAQEMMDGLVQIWTHPPAGLALSGIFILRTIGMFVAISAVLVIKKEYAAEAHDLRLDSSALALGAAGIGAFLGALTAPAAGRRLAKPGLILLGFVVSGTGIIALGGVVDIWAVLGLMLIGGYGGFVSKVATDAQVQEALPDEYRGRAFALYDILYNLASVAAAAAMVALIEVSFRRLLVAAGFVCFALAGLLAVAMKRERLPLLAC